MIKMVLFDLDGTLLPMDQDVFVKYYFGLLAKKLAPLGYDPKKLVDSVWMGTSAMVRNNGSCNNEEAFWLCFSSIYGEQVRNDMPVFESFYANEFQGSKVSCGYNPKAAEVVAALKKAGTRVALATNPLFPAIATQSRIGWAGLNQDDFEFITTYENSHYCKPNPEYYEEVCSILSVDPSECLMIGNDIEEDMIAASTVGLKVFLLKDCIINAHDADISQYPQGDFDDLLLYLKELELV